MNKLPLLFSRLSPYHRIDSRLLARQFLSTIPLVTYPSSSIACNKNTTSSYKTFGSLLRAGVKTSTTAAKRFIRMGSGVLKHGHAGTAVLYEKTVYKTLSDVSFLLAIGKRHLNRGKGRVRLNRLGKMSVLKGVWLKKMNKLLD